SANSASASRTASMPCGPWRTATSSLNAYAPAAPASANAHKVRRVIRDRFDVISELPHRRHEGGDAGELRGGLSSASGLFRQRFDLRARVRVLRVELERSPVTLDRFGRPAGGGLGFAEAVPGVGGVRMIAHDALEHPDRVVGLAEAEQGVAEGVEVALERGLDRRAVIGRRREGGFDTALL